MPEQRRLDPETILKRMKMEEADESDNSGILKIYLGYSAGVGKTYRMLLNAQNLKKNGVDAVVGIAETHGRVDTDALLNGLEIVPRKKVVYQGITVDEFDIDAVLKRRPGLVLVDELAHTNIPGSRHNKRYEDIEELINNGINVATTLNVQHLESINDIIEQMTGVNVKETVPDNFFDKADEIELVDIPIEELETRLKEGKVYIPEKARIAMLEFFKRSNLMGLRELSLRYTARQVSDELLDYMRQNAIKSPIPVGSRILVAISPSLSSQKLIRIGHRMSEDLDAEWFTVHVESVQFGNLEELQRTQVSKNLKLAEDLGAKTVTLIADRVADELASFAKENHITLILIGFSSRSRFDNFIRGSVVDELIRKARPVQVMLVDTSPEPRRKVKKTEGVKVLEWTKYLASASVIIAFTLLSYLFFKILGFTNIIMIMLIPVLLVSYFGGRSQGIWASLLAVIALDFFFVKPYYSFAISDILYLPIFIIFFVVGVTTSVLSDLVRWRIDRYRRQEKFLNTIYNFSKELLTHNFLNEILGSITNNFGDFFKCDVMALLPGKEDTVKIMASTERSMKFGENEIGISQWVYKNGKTAGKGTDTLSSSPWYYIPMSANNSVIGVIAVYKRGGGGDSFTKEEIAYLDSFANIAAMSVSRALSMSSYMDYVIKSLETTKTEGE